MKTLESKHFIQQHLPKGWIGYVLSWKDKVEVVICNNKYMLYETNDFLEITKFATRKSRIYHKPNAFINRYYNSLVKKGAKSE